MDSAANPVVRALDPRAKIAWVAVVILALFLFEIPAVQFTATGAVLAVLVAGSLTGRLRSRLLLATLQGLLGMMVLVILLQGFLRGGQTELFGFPLFGGRARFTLEGMTLGLVVAARLTSISLAFLMFMTTTPAYDLSVALYKLGIPYKYAFLVSMAFDRSPQAVARTRDIANAQSARGFDLESGGPLQKVRNLLPILVPLVVMSLRQANDISVALELKGFGDPSEVKFIDDLVFRPLDRLVTGLAALLAVTMVAARIRLFFV